MCKSRIVKFQKLAILINLAYIRCWFDRGFLKFDFLAKGGKLIDDGERYREGLAQFRRSRARL